MFFPHDFIKPKRSLHQPCSSYPPHSTFWATDAFLLSRAAVDGAQCPNRSTMRSGILDTRTDHRLRSYISMPVLKKQPLEAYIRSRYGPNAQLDSYGPAGKEIRGAKYKQYGYGAPIRLNIRLGRRLIQVVLATMSPGPFGHEHMADRAQAMLWDYDSYGRLPRHVRSLDVGAFTSDGALMSVAAGREYFVLNEWSEGKGYDQDLRRLSKTGKARALDKKRAVAMASYLAAIHRVKRKDPDLYRRRLRELIGHGECIMGLTDSYPKRYAFITGRAAAFHRRKL